MSQAVDLVLVGAQKAGTSALYGWLTAHPGICAGSVKEPLYFTDELGLEDGRADGPARSGRNRRGRAWFDSLFDCESGQLRLDGSTDYFSSPPAPALLHAEAPDARIVVCLRHPVDRVVSHYWHERRFLDLPPLADLVANGHPRLDFYLRCSRYAENLDRWLAAFDAEAVLVVTSEQLRNNPDEVVADVLDQVGLPPFDRAVSDLSTESNPAALARSPRLQRLITTSRLRDLGESLPAWLRRPVAAVAKRVVRSNLVPADYEPLDQASRALLSEAIASDVARLPDLLAPWPSAAETARRWGHASG